MAGIWRQLKGLWIAIGLLASASALSGCGNKDLADATAPSTVVPAKPPTTGKGPAAVPVQQKPAMPKN